MTRDEWKARRKAAKRELRKARRKGPLFFDRHPYLDAVTTPDVWLHQRNRRQADARCLAFYRQDKGVAPVLQPGDTVTVLITMSDG